MVRGKPAGRTSRRTAWISAFLAWLVVAAFVVTPAWAGKIHGKLQGVVGGLPTTGLTLPLPFSASNVMATLFLGGTSGPPVPFTITPNTKVDAEDSKEKGSGGTVMLVNGDSIEVKAKAQQVGSTIEIVATRIKLENPEIEAFGAVTGLGTMLTIPLPADSADVPIIVSLGGIGGPTITVKITSNTKVSGGATVTLGNGDFVEFKAVLQGDMIIVKKIRKENPEDVEDE